MSSAIQPVRHGVDRHDLRASRRPRTHRRRRCRPAAVARTPLRGPPAQRCAPCPALVVLDASSRRPSSPCACRNVFAIAPPIRISSAALEQPLDDADLVGHLGAAERRRRTGARGASSSADSVATSRSRRCPAARRQQVRDALRRGVRAVRGAERVVHVDVGVAPPAPARTAGRSPPRRRGSGGSRAAARRRRRASRRPSPPRRRRSPSANATSPPSSSPAAPRPAAARTLGSTLPFGRPRCEQSTTRAPRSRQVLDRRQRRADARVVADARRPSSGTLKSTRTNTRLPAQVAEVVDARAVRHQP